jgi:hypothetical protein
MKKLSVNLTFSCGDQRADAADFQTEDDFDLTRSEYLAREMFRECQVALLYAPHRSGLPAFRFFTDQMNWFAPKSGTADVTRWAAHMNTAQAWWQIQNGFTESAHLLARARAYHDVEAAARDDDTRLYLHMMKIQHFDAAVHLICKIEDWFLLLLFVNSGASLIPAIDVHTQDWKKQIRRGAIRNGLRKRKSGDVRRSNPYLDALTDQDYRTINQVFKKLGKPLAVRAIREYRNEIAHRGVPAVDDPGFSPAFKFPKKKGRVVSFGIPAGARIEYEFLEIYAHAVDALRHMETQLLRLKQIPVLTPM